MNQKDTAKIVRCANQTVVDSEKWLREETYDYVARICDDQSIKKMVATDAIYWGLIPEDLVKLDRLTQDFVLRHYRADYLEIPDLSSPRFQKHTVAVLNLLDNYVTQLKVSIEPEHFLPKKDEPTDKEITYWLYLKEVVPSIEDSTIKTIESGSLVFSPEFEGNPLFSALKAHYRNTKLWKDIKAYKESCGEYLSIGYKFRWVCGKLLNASYATEIQPILYSLTELLKIDLGHVRVKLELDGIEKDLNATLQKLPTTDDALFNQGFNQLKEHIEGDIANEPAKSVVELAQLIDRLPKSYDNMKRREKEMNDSIVEQKLFSNLPTGTKCKFC